MPASRTSPATYVAFVVVPAVIIVALLQLGPAPLSQAASSMAGAMRDTARPSAAGAFSLPLLILQLVLVLASARAVGAAARAMGQPAVIGEMLAGIALGPSLLGAMAPQVASRLFPVASLGFLNALSQLGVLLFLFVVGLHVDLHALRRQRGVAVIASHASIAAPFTLGVALALPLFPRFAPAGVPFSAFALFLGVAMSITAFPVLARILEERRLLHTPLGTLAVACAAVDDVTAWTLLAVVVALVQRGGAVTPLLITLAGTVAFVLVLFGVVRPLLARLDLGRDDDRVSYGTMSVLLVLVLLSALVTEAIGIHALFGAFIAGTLVPRRHRFAERVASQLSDLLVVLLLPLFFAYTGLRTDFAVIGQAGGLALLAIITVAIVGKVGGTALAARTSGQPWIEAARLGVLMNTRGLMELVVLNIGLDLGVLSPPLFAMMVVMALVTTTMTVPSLALLDRVALRMGRR